MKKYIAVPIVATVALAMTATGAYAAARGFDRSDADAQTTGSSEKCLGKTPTTLTGRRAMSPRICVID